MKRVVSVMLLSTSITVMSFTQTDLQPAAVVRLTKTEPITVKQFKTELERVEKQAGRVFSTDEQRQILNVMIDEKLALQAAERDKIVVSDNEINQHIQHVRNDMAQQQSGRQPTDAEFAAVVKEQTGLEVPVFREQIRKQMITQKYLLSKKENLLKSIKIPTDAEILEMYALTKSQFVRPETVRFSIIQIPFGPDAPSKTKAKEVADRLLLDIGSNPAKFDEAVVKGLSGNAAYQSGDGGYLPRIPESQRLVGQNFMNTAFSLKQGEVSKVMEGPKGYEIIKITETYEQKSLDIDDIFQMGTRMTVRDYIGNMLLQDRQQKILKQATQELTTELRKGNPFQVMEKNLGWQ